LPLGRILHETFDMPFGGYAMPPIAARIHMVVAKITQALSTMARIVLPDFWRSMRMSVKKVLRTANASVPHAIGDSEVASGAFG